MKPAEVRRIALSLPETEEKETWGDATFRVRDKIFVAMGSDGETAGVKTDRTNQALLVRSMPNVFSVTHYVGRFGWVTARLDAVDDETMRELIIDSWRRTAPKTLVKQYAAGATTAAPKRSERKSARKATRKAAAKRPKSARQRDSKR
jgi:hypothetical protein